MARKITEKMLLDGYDGKTNGGDNISLIGSRKIYWAYRTGQQGDGYNTVCARKHAGEITLEYDRFGKIELNNANENHPTITQIAADEEKLWGTMV